VDIELLNLEDPTAIIEWETALYTAFINVKGNRLIRHLWLWDDTNQRLAMRIGYSDQRIYYWRNAEGILTSGMAINVGMQQFQASAFGFPMPEREGDENIHCEVLAAINSEHWGLAGDFQFRRTMFSDLYQLGFRWVWATTSDRNYHLYQRMGAELVEEKWIGEERRRLLRFRLGVNGSNAEGVGEVHRPH
jgi:hypothetical protein